MYSNIFGRERTAQAARGPSNRLQSLDDIHCQAFGHKNLEDESQAQGSVQGPSA